MKNVKERKDLLKKFYDSFVEHTKGKIKCVRIDKGVAQGGWFELKFLHHLTCEDLLRISDFIYVKFSESDRFTHLSAKIAASRDGIILYVQDSAVQKLADGGKI